MTTNAPATVDEDALVVRRTIRIDAPVDRVWAAVTEPEHISRWFGRVELQADEGTITWPDHTPIPLRVAAIDEPRSVTYRWNNDDALGTAPAAFDPTTATEFTFTLEPVEGGTQLTVVETGFEATTSPVQNLREHGTGWTLELDKLVALLEA